MATTVYFANVSKRRNSTLQGTFSTSFDVVLKEPTSIDRPKFHLSAASFDYNAAKWGNRYYFVDDVVSVGNGRWEVSCVLDVLATYKADILASTQFVSYSSAGNGTWLPDVRIPVESNATTAENSISVPIFNNVGSYILTTLGMFGVSSYRVSKSTLNNLVEELQTWVDDANDVIKNGLSNTLESLASALIDTGVVGNTYELAPQCVRNCVWVPFDAGTIDGGSSLMNLTLGNYQCKDSGGNFLYGYELNTIYFYLATGINIPWQYSDWRRAQCESVYLFLPFVGMIQLSSDSLAQETYLQIIVTITPSDGGVCYEVKAGNQTLGTFGGECAAQVPVGINQLQGLGKTASTVIGGLGKNVAKGVVSTVVATAASGIGGGVATGVASLVGTAAHAAYDVANGMNTTNPTVVGGVGGGAAGGQDLTIRCYTVAHSTSTNPASMQNTMGLPTMKPMSLATLTGFCQCANAHVSAAAQAQELDALDSYLNSGFYIE